jgi:hypothetical protein
MRKSELVFISMVVALLAHSASAQSLSVAAGLGLEYYNVPSLSRYFAVTTGGVTPGTYIASVQLEAGADFFIASDWTVGIEYAYLTNQSTGNGIQINYSYSLPTLMLRRVVAGDNYYLRVGGGLGYHFFSLNQNVGYGTTNYSSKGIGLKFDGALDSKLGENFYARVTVDARAEFTGILKTSTGAALINVTNSSEVNSNLSGVGISFGLVYYF